MHNAQTIEALATAMLFALQRFDGVPWSLSSLAAYLSATHEDMNAATSWAIKRRLVFVIRDGYAITDAGADHLESTRNNQQLELSRSERDFREEVLTGTTSAGRETQLCNAVLPCTTQHRSRSPDRIIDDMLRAIRVRQLAASAAGVALSDLDALSTTGALRVCRHCGQLSIHDKNGARLRSMCRMCRKQKRKQAKRNAHN